MDSVPSDQGFGQIFFVRDFLGGELRAPSRTVQTLLRYVCGPRKRHASAVKTQALVWVYIFGSPATLIVFVESAKRIRDLGGEGGFICETRWVSRHE